MTNLTLNRYAFFLLLTMITISMDIVTDPDSGILNDLSVGAGIASYLVVLGRSLMAVMFLHWARTFIFGDELSIGKLLTNDNKGQIAIAIAIITLAFAIVMHSVIAL